MKWAQMVESAAWPGAAIASFGILLSALLVLAGSSVGLRYAELPDPAMRVGLPPGYDYCDASDVGPYYLICDRAHEVVFPNQARYYIWIFDAETSSRFGYVPQDGIRSAREGIVNEYFGRRSVEGEPLVINSTLRTAPVTVDGHDALEFQVDAGLPDLPNQPQQRLLVIGLPDGRLVELFNTPGGIPAGRDESNFRVIARGIKFRPAN